MTARTQSSSPSVDDLVAADKALVEQVANRNKAEQARIAKRRKELDDAEATIKAAAEFKLDLVAAERAALQEPTQAPKSAQPSSSASSEPTPTQERVRELANLGVLSREQIAASQDMPVSEVNNILDLDPDTELTRPVLDGLFVRKLGLHDKEFDRVGRRLDRLDRHVGLDSSTPEPPKAHEPALSEPTEERKLVDDLPDKGGHDNNGSKWYDKLVPGRYKNPEASKPKGRHI